jgi:YjjI family glycine radical enzyme
LPLGGGSYTLARVNLRRLVEAGLADRHSRAEILGADLTKVAEAMLALMEARIRFIVEESGFFENSYLVKEGLISRDRFTAMFGVVGLAEAVNLLLGYPADGGDAGGRYGHSAEALELGEAILIRFGEELRRVRLPYCEVSDGLALLHAQAGISEDVGVTAGVRIPAGDEPDLLSHLNWAARLHPHFPSGISDPMHFDSTARDNPMAVADILKGAFHQGMREFTFNLKDSEFVRVTGYLVRRSVLTTLAQGRASRYDTTALSQDPVVNQGVDSRVARSV